MTYRDILNYARSKNFKDYEDEAIFFIIEETLNISRSKLLLSLDNDIEKEEIIKKLVDEYVVNGNPPQYILNTAYFYGNKYYVDNNVLIPRFDTEVVVEKAIEHINKKYGNNNIDIVDIGTGSGIIAITLKKELANANVSAVDISNDALNVAKKNAKELGVDINFINNDLLKGLNLKYDVIISNPPYINDSEYVMDMVANNEPKIALYSSDNGLYHYKEIIKESLVSLKDNGMIIFEIPDNKCDELSEFVSKYYNSILIFKDYNNMRRVMIIEDKK